MHERTRILTFTPVRSVRLRAFGRAVSVMPIVAAASLAAGQVAPPTPIAPATGTAGSADARGSQQARFDGALRMMKAGAFEQAAGVCRVILAEDASSDRAAALLGIALSKQKKYEEARPQLERARDSRQSFPERVHAPHFLGWCLFHLGELEAARRAFEAHLASVPNEPDSTFGLALVALGEDRLDDAGALFDKALAGFTEPKPRLPDQARVLTRMADLALRRDDPAKAESLLERAAQASPLQPEVWAKLARVRDRLGMHEKADAARANETRILEALGRRAAQGGEGGAVDPKPSPEGAPVSPTGPGASPATSPTSSPTSSPATSPTSSPSTSPSTSPKSSPESSPATSPATSLTTTPTTSPATSPATSPNTLPATSPVSPRATPPAAPGASAVHPGEAPAKPSGAWDGSRA